MASSHNETIIAQGVTVEGDFSSQGDVSIDGEVKGSVKTQQNLRVGDSAKIHADVSAQAAIIAGEIIGNIIVDGRLELLETSVVTGNVSAGMLSVSAGARLNGQVNMGGAGSQMEEEE